MPNYIASYDLTNTSPTPYAEFTKQAEARGWGTWITVDGGVRYKLPNTTLYGSYPDRDAAVRALEETRAATQRALGKCIMEKWIVSDSPQATLNSDVVR